MKALDVLGSGIKKAAAAAAGVVAPPLAKRNKDPFYSDLERRAEVNERSGRGLSRWLGPRRRGWLR